MSENLRRLKREVSEKEIKAATVRHIKSEVYKYKYLPSEKRAIELTALSGMASVEELERKAEEARKEEQRVKEELKLTKEEIERKLLRTIAQQIEDEEKGYWAYQILATQLTALDLEVTAKDVLDYANDEVKHKEGLKRLFQTIAKKPFKMPEEIKPWSLEELRKRE